jgi:eukaryotic-like serine/threonine-protein kinase
MSGVPAARYNRLEPMPLNTGTRLGPYEIVAPLGAGGMGEVYRAHDSRLGRDVALKVLPAEVASDPAREQRFETEARAVAALNHPNIMAIYDVALQEQPAFIVSELVSGETLRGVIQRGPVPLKKVLDIAVQIAEGRRTEALSGRGPVRATGTWLRPICARERTAR